MINLPNFLSHKIILLSLILFGALSCKDEITCPPNSILIGNSCECLNGFDGYNCEIEDSCITQNKECLNDGICVSGTCNCLGFWSGDKCEFYSPILLKDTFLVVETKTISQEVCSGLDDYLIQEIILDTFLTKEWDYFYANGVHTRNGYNGEKQYLSENFNGHTYSSYNGQISFSMNFHFLYQTMSHEFNCVYSQDSIKCSGKYYIDNRYYSNTCLHEIEFIAVRK